MATPKPDKVVTLIAATLDAVGDEPVELDGGPFDVPLNRAAALWLIPWICEPECRLAARVSMPKAKKPRALYATPGDARDALRILRELQTSLAKVTGGTLEFLAVSAAEMNATAAGDDEGYDDDDGDEAAADVDTSSAETATRRAAARFRLTGPVTDGTWHVTSAWPHVKTAELRDAFAILDLVEGSSTRWARDAAEAAAIADLAAKSTGFIRTNPAQVNANSLEVNGADIVVKEDRRPYLATVIFRLRLGAARWDVRTAQDADEVWLATYHESLKQMAVAAAKIAERHWAPRLRTIAETPIATYYETDLAKIRFQESDMAITPLITDRLEGVHYRDEVKYADALPLIDAQIGAMGFARLGDFQNSSQDRRQAFRCYGGATDGTFIMVGIVAGAFMLHFIFYTLLGADFWVTTATFPLGDKAPRPKRGSHRGVGKTRVTAQAVEHAKHVAEHAGEGTPHASPTSMDELIVLADAFNAAHKP